MAAMGRRQTLGYDANGRLADLPFRHVHLWPLADGPLVAAFDPLRTLG